MALAALVALAGCGGEGVEGKDRRDAAATEAGSAEGSASGAATARPEGESPARPEPEDAPGEQAQGDRPGQRPPDAPNVFQGSDTRVAERLCAAFRARARLKSEQQTEVDRYVDPDTVDPKQACARLRKAARSSAPDALAAALRAIDRDSDRWSP